jgi:8-oxo-dGTP diphosphatase
MSVDQQTAPLPPGRQERAGREDRFYPLRPMVAVGAVVWDGENVLLARRGRPPAEHVWALPGGLIELGETAAEAARREVSEECGIAVTVGPVLGLFEPMERDSEGRIRYHFVVVDFLADYSAGELRAGDDAAEVRWVDPADFPAYDLQPATREMIERALALIRGRGHG